MALMVCKRLFSISFLIFGPSAYINVDLHKYFPFSEPRVRITVKSSVTKVLHRVSNGGAAPSK